MSDIDKEAVSDIDEEAVSDIDEEVVSDIGDGSEEEEGDDALFVSSLKSALAKSSSNNYKEEEGTRGLKVAERGLNKKKGSMVVKVINLKGK